MSVGGDLLKCSFCGKSQKQVKKLIAGPMVYICDECIDLCNEIIEEELVESSDVGLGELLKPREIHAFLGEYVIGQDRAKRALAVAVYNHYKRIQAEASLTSKKDPEHVEPPTTTSRRPRPASSTSMRSTRLRARLRTPRSPVTCPARVSSRRY